MQSQRIVLCLAIAIGGGLTVALPASSQEYRGTWEQQMACTPDVWRLCGAAIPDVDRIVACLRQNTPNLSDGCRAVFESNNSMDQQQVPSPPRGRVAPSPGTRVSPQRIVPPTRPNDDDD